MTKSILICVFLFFPILNTFQSATSSPEDRELDKLTKDLEHVPKDTVIEWLARERKKNDKNLERIGGLKYDKTQLMNPVMWLSCKKDLRWRMGIFGWEFGLQGGKRLRTSRAFSLAFNTIKAALKQRSSTLHDGASKLAILYEEHNSVSFRSPDGKTEGWIERVKNAYNLLKTVIITPKVLPTIPSLGDVIMEIQAAPDEQKAVNLFKIQCESYYWSWIGFDHLEESNETRKLATLLSEQEIKDLIQDCDKNNKYKLDLEDLRFFRDLLDTGSYFVSNSKHHEACAEVFYFAPSSKLELMKKDLEENWPGTNFATRVNTFCDSFARLYDLVGVGEIHVPTQYLPIECTSNSTYYYEFLKDLVKDSAYSIDDFIFISKIFGKISSEFTAPATE